MPANRPTQETTQPLNPNQAVVPQPGRRRKLHMTAPATQRTQRNKGLGKRKVLVIVPIVVLVLVFLAIAIYFIKQLIDSKYFFCTSSLRFIPIEKACDGKKDCPGGEDETTCASNLTVTSTFPVRLVTNLSVLQVYSNVSGWRSVCSDRWTQQHTQTACGLLGYTYKPLGASVPVSSLAGALKHGPFAAVKPGTATAPTDQATADSTACGSGSVVSLSCSDCGQVHLQDRIVGGKDAYIEDWPWQVSLQDDGQHTCGGSLVAPNWVVSAAHCFSGVRKELKSWRVVSGQTYMASLGGSYVDKIIVNGQYDPVLSDYDIAMLRLSSPITVGDSRRPVCLPPKALGLSAGDTLTVTGWGYLRENGQVSPSLQMAQINFIDRDTCSSPQVYGSTITPRMICAGVMAGGVDACQGDSGGPLVYDSSSKWNLVGVVSWGDGCARKGQPGVYTNVDEMLNWIYTVMQKNP
ncbi:transmembrane protease serine 4a isoform X2 [Betta splendens]|uniref:Transmembrane protease serine 4a isoform X2 n=1 Tax=Betta splendens TaxID=158456 RepID=A0A6P7PFP5_BETSP|nr:transmembrane protease serine 4a isoform X2 [Betta splendens]